MWKANIFLKNLIESAWNFDFKEVNFGRYAICNAMFLDILELIVENESLENMVSEIN